MFDLFDAQKLYLRPKIQLTPKMWHNAQKAGTKLNAQNVKWRPVMQLTPNNAIGAQNTIKTQNIH